MGKYVNILLRYIFGGTIVNRTTIAAVLNKDLIVFLESLGELDKVNAGEVRCEYCNRIITLDNIQNIFPENNEVKYCCNNSLCLFKLHKERGE